ncbi:hypothetical protein [Vibrio agarivorans]|uniref:Uncharacterized protein n=1 Tax=Vibrio agarivorans TaxID=153622 RepID=A0ABT7Y794_9VIBR|nr:hypothetical protein [Vibrio agarivorans]MDN2483870.1 hypothetical protein [Vibrio agarivorans]
MKISISTTQSKEFKHSRTGTAIKVGEGSGVLVTLVGKEREAAFEISSREELDQFSSMLTSVGGNEKRNLGFSQDYMVLSIDREVFGEPFEECVELVVTEADPDKAWCESEVVAHLDYALVKPLLDEMEMVLETNQRLLGVA